MAISVNIRVLNVIIILFMIDSIMLQAPIRNLNGYNHICRNVTSNPAFETKFVVGKPWRIYFAWNLNLGARCMQTTLKRANPTVVKNLKRQLYAMRKQPRWSQAVLYSSMGPATGMVLFKDGSGVPGRFEALPDFVPKWREQKMPKLYKMTMKVLHKGRYLLISDCTSGMTSLNTRRENRPTRAEMAAVAATMSYGTLFPACIKEPDLVPNSTENSKIST